MSEKVVNIFCAQPICDEEARNITIRIHVPVPDVKACKNVRAYRDVFMKQGDALADALCFALPVGTLDALLVSLLDRKRSLFRVPLFPETKGANENEVEPSTD